MHRIGWLFALLAWAGAATGQDYRPVATVSRDCAFFTTDPLGNAYLVDADGLFKYDPDGRLLSSFSNKGFGKITSVDATDPLKIVLFNSAFRKVYLLDDKLAVRSSFDLLELGMEQPTLICMSRYDGYWVYDAVSRQLVKFNNNLQRVADGELLAGRLPGLDPDYLVESSRYIFLHDPATGVILADRYGTYFKTLHDVHGTGFQCEDESIWFAEDGELVRLQVATRVRATSPLPEGLDARQVRVEKNRLYVSTADAFYIYSF